MRRVVAAAILLGCAALVPHKCTRQRLQPARAERSHCCNALGVSALAEPLLRRAAQDDIHEKKDKNTPLQCTE